MVTQLRQENAQNQNKMLQMVQAVKKEENGDSHKTPTTKKIIMSPGLMKNAVLSSKQMNSTSNNSPVKIKRGGGKNGSIDELSPSIQLLK